ncbi:glycoside hydrolase family 140 protein [Paenibacillus sp. PsM32]|uniref:glycoside hydrolase family 140 protein n=1 Tax=Paenibacillus sp. PsM32 TaxID=3030536 RepID=UPI00263BC01A|nr:glycoside hydrolase family 140 protein [Paenibacillus sp. PsM32]MDN4617878.1 glycoside hydrolase family 140 protein [Paenibacillus sp. PsM32]
MSEICNEHESIPQMSRLKVSPNQRFVIQEDGTPFFWLGDTAWELFHRLDREQALLYLTCRAEQGFNVVQAVALAELDGITTGNAYHRMPLLMNKAGVYDPCLPDTTGDYSYWDHVDYIVNTAATLGIYIAFLPTWGDKYNQLWGKGPEIFTADNAYTYGQWLGERYRNCNNIIWVLGGDRSLDQPHHIEIIDRLAEGLQAGDGHTHLITFHPKGSASSSQYVHPKSWLDFHMIQSGHAAGVRNNYVMIQHDYELQPIKPVLEAEPCYEDIPIDFKASNGYFDEVHVRQTAYYAVLAGSLGYTYGHHSVWCMSDGMYASTALDEIGDFIIMSWQQALTRPGAEQMKWLRQLMQSVDFVTGVPDQSVVTANFAGANYQVASRGIDYILVYCPQGLYVKVRLGILNTDQVSLNWYCPRSGQLYPIDIVANDGVHTLIAPSSGRGQDWVLYIHSVRKE